MIEYFFIQLCMINFSINLYYYLHEISFYLDFYSYENVRFKFIKLAMILLLAIAMILN